MRRCALGVVAACACTADVGVTLRLDVPDDALAGAATLRLTATADGEVIHTAVATPPVRGAPIAFGEVPIAAGVTFELAGLAATGRVVAYGRSGAVDVPDDGVIDVAIPVRRPYVYLAGGDALLAIDAAREPGDTTPIAIDVGGSPTAARVTPDGVEVVVVAGGALRLVDTATHQVGAAAVPLGGDATDLAVSDDGRWAVASLGAAGAIAIVELAALRAGAEVTPARVPATRPGAIALGGGTAWVVDEPSDDLFCTARSTVRAIPLDDPASAAAIPLGTAGGEIAATPDGEAAFVVRACSGEVVRIARDGATSPVPAVAGASSVTVARGRLWIGGHVDGADAHLLLGSVPLAGGDLDLLALPTTVERAVAVDLVEAGQDGLIEVTADLSAPSHVTVLPDGEHVALILTAGYLTEPAGDAGGGQPVIPALRMITSEYQLVQLDTGLGAQRLRLRCDLTWEPGALLDEFACDRAPGQDVLDAAVSPTGLGALYGSR